MKQTMKVTIILICIIFLSLSCNPKQESTIVALENITESVYASGIVKSKNQYQVFSNVNGLIETIYVTEGDQVKIGDPILKIINKTAQLNADNAQLVADNSTIKANINKLSELQINIELSKIKLDNDASLFKRQGLLWAQQIGSRNDLDVRELAYKSSQTAYKAAQLRYKDLKKQVDFSSEQAKNNYKISSTAYGDYTVRSNINGKVYNLIKEKGEMVNAQTMVAIIGDDKDFILELQVDEYDIAKLKLGQKAFISMDSYKGKVYEAIIDKINPIMNERSRSFKLEARFITRPLILFPNLTTEANIIIQTKNKALTVPRNYLVDETYVLLKDNKKVKVEIGLKDYEKVEILKGLTVNDVIFKELK
jgi:RND family efflux transporter MFP subunit